jgi:hypothetical protein
VVGWRDDCTEDLCGRATSCPGNDITRRTAIEKAAFLSNPNYL